MSTQAKCSYSNVLRHTKHKGQIIWKNVLLLFSNLFGKMYLLLNLALGASRVPAKNVMCALLLVVDQLVRVPRPRLNALAQIPVRGTCALVSEVRIERVEDS